MEIFARGKHVMTATGAPMAGPQSDWPAWMVDAAQVIEVERIQEHNASALASQEP